MDGHARKAFERGTRVAHVSDAQPDTDQAQAGSVAKVKEMTARMEEVAALQRAGLIDVHAAALEKRKLRRAMLAGPIAHLAEVGRLAARENHELATTFRFKPSADSFVSFRTAARSMQAEAEAHKELLARHGLSEPVLALFGDLLDRFDAAVALGVDGRTSHKGATKQLRALATELASVIRVMDAQNRQRFQDNPQLLESWISASTVLGVKRAGNVAPAEPPAGGESKNAA